MIKGDLIEHKDQYNFGMQELRAFLSAGTTWKDLAVGEFSEKSRLFKNLLVLSELAMREGIYQENELKDELQEIKQAIKRLLL